MSRGAAFAETFFRTIRGILKRPIFWWGIGNWLDEIDAVTKQYDNKKRSSTKLSQSKHL